MRDVKNPMVREVRFQNFKALRSTKLPLGPFTLIIGPNGSGKSTALQGLQVMARAGNFQYDQLVTAGLPKRSPVEITVCWAPPFDGVVSKASWSSDGRVNFTHDVAQKRPDNLEPLTDALSRINIYSFEGRAISSPVALQPFMGLEQNGVNLPGVLDGLRDREPERFEMVNEELARWIPEFDRILFDTPSKGMRAFRLRTRHSRHAISASDLSQGTLFALAILTLAYLPDPPPIICIEEPDRGIHPRLLRDVRDALYRLSSPTASDPREPVQVIATTHSPYFLDLYKDHPDEVVIAHKAKEGVRFESLSERSDLNEILGDIHLSDAWYSGILGGVPADE